MMNTTSIDTKGVFWPKTPCAKDELQKLIDQKSKEGYVRFATETVRCLNGIESPSPDEPMLDWDRMGFVHDCEPERVNDETAVFPDVILWARKNHDPVHR